MADRLVYADTDKRIYVTAEASDDEPQQERVEWLRDTPEWRIAALEDRVEAVSALAEQASVTAQEVAQAARDGKGPPER